ncbi:MAG: CoA transferase, partial [Gammaproteobacteria bacterium]|nr:CoA transferase [Gammaproteobacteria bacterium]
MLADLGADVIKIEPPCVAVDATDWRAGNVNKRLLRLDPACRIGREAIERMIGRVDVLIETASPGEPGDAWLQFERLSRLNPG